MIDGYNVINAWTDVFDLQNEPLEESRNKFLHILSNFQGFRNINIIVVFDAHLVKKSRGAEEKFDNLTIIYTKENETADNYIERFVYRMGNDHRVRVVTSDYLEQTLVLSKGGIRMAPRELKAEIAQAARDTKMDTVHYGKKQSNSIMANIKPELLEKLDKMRRDKF